MSPSFYPEPANAKIDDLRQLPIVQSVLEELRSKLPPNLKYHCAKHTDNVLSEVVYFAVTDGLPEREIHLLAVAAAYHDAGFLIRIPDNEELGAEMAEKAMRAAKGYSQQEIRLVKDMIMDTKLKDSGVDYKKRPSSELSKYLLDADLSNLGREDFFARLEQLHQEMGGDPELHLHNSYRLLKNHHWLTPAATAAREECKQRNLAKLAERIGAPV